MKITGKDVFFVGLQGILFLALLWKGPYHLETHKAFYYIGWTLAILGSVICILALMQLNTSLSPFPTPVQKGQLITQGLYTKIRHPIYSGILLVALGWGLLTGSPWRLLLALALLILFFFKARYEEGLLSEKYTGYEEYKKKSGMFVPPLLY
ncbi:MAG: isoprenylcysteine carboxylmethyltransferase family protein [Saprospiraceae bacterium]|nr:isoprenylcysteine carboxylmethyltransferase family protein [Saprospiraceae bacterium]